MINGRSTNLILIEGGVARDLIARNESWKPIIEKYNDVVKIYALFRGGQAVSSLFRASIYKLIELKPLITQLRNNLDGDLLKTANRIDGLVDDIERAAHQNGIDLNIPPTLPTGPSLRSGIYGDLGTHIVNKGYNLAKIEQASGFINPGLKTFVNASKMDVVVEVSNASLKPSSTLTAMQKELLVTEGIGTIADAYPNVNITRELAIKMLTTTDEVAAVQTLTQAVPSSLKPALAKVINTIDGNLIIVEPDVSTGLKPQLLYAESSVASKLIEKVEEKKKCNVCANRSFVVCRKFESVWTRAGGITDSNHKIGIDRMCASSLDESQLLKIGDHLLQSDFSPKILSSFLNDLAANYQDKSSLYKNLSTLSTSLIDSWMIVYDARKNITRANDERHRSDIESLKKIRAIKGAPSSAFMTSEMVSGLKEFMASNTRLGCNPCLATPVKHLNLMDAYLSDLEYFVNNFKGKNGYAQVVKSLKSSADPWYRVEPSAFVLRVIRKDKDTFSPRNVLGFEKTLRGCVTDVVLSGDVYVEFKSWAKSPETEISEEDLMEADQSKSVFENLVIGKGSYKQFIAYLNNIEQLSQLKYYFDGRKLYGGDNDMAGYESEREWVKSKFRELFKHPVYGNEIFEILHSKSMIQGELGFTAGIKSDNKKIFDKLVDETDERLYSFINVE